VKIPSDASPSVQQAFREVWQAFNSLQGRDIDLKGRSVVNAGRALHGQETPTLAQVRDYVRSVDFSKDFQQSTTIVNQVSGGGGGGAFGTHQILSPTHSDTVASGATRGDLITANSSALWTRLALGAASTFLMSNGSDLAYQAVGWSDSGSIVSSTAARSVAFPVTANGANLTFGVNSESITITAFETDSAADLLPANSLILFGTGRVTTNLLRDGVAATSWNISDPTTNARIMGANTGVTAGSTGLGIQHWLGSVTTDAAGPTQLAAAKVRIRVNAGAGSSYSGVVRVSIFYLTATAPTS
jgi:hypothetical protein